MNLLIFTYLLILILSLYEKSNSRSLIEYATQSGIPVFVLMFGLILQAASALFIILSYFQKPYTRDFYFCRGVAWLMIIPCAAVGSICAGSQGNWQLFCYQMLMLVIPIQCWIYRE